MQRDTSYCSKRLNNRRDFSGTETANDRLVLHELFSNALSFLDLVIERGRGMSRALFAKSNERFLTKILSQDISSGFVLVLFCHN